MGRPAKSIEVQTRHNTKAETQARRDTEKMLRGADNKLRPPKYLSGSQKKIFRGIVTELKESGVLGNLDVYILTQCAIAIDRLQMIETMINIAPERITDKDLLSAKDKYTKDLYRCCNELCLSPQARAKIGSINIGANKEKNDPLLQILNDGRENETQ